MQQEYEKVETDLVVSDHLDLYGMALGNVTVQKDGLLNLYGTLSRDLHVEQGGHANIYGSVHGTIFNNGGSLDIKGTVKRVVENGGTTVIASTAVIKGR